MKNVNLLFVVVILLSSFISCDLVMKKETGEVSKVETQVSKTNPLVGTWTLVNATHISPEGIRMKHFTDTHFSWYWAGADGQIAASAGGNYSLLSDSSFIEKIEVASPSMAPFVGTEGTIQFELVGDTLKAKGKMEKKWFPFQRILGTISVISYRSI